MPKSVGAKRTTGRGQNKSLPAPPAKKPRKEACKVAPLDKENVSPMEDVSTNKAKPMVPSVPEPEKKISVSKVVPEDPVSQSLAVVEDALEDQRQIGLLKLPDYVCEMLRIAVPTSLGHGSALEERHAIQTKMADTIGSYLQQVAVICEQDVKEQEEQLQAAKMAKEQGMSALTALEAKLEEQASLVKQKQGNLENAEKEVSAAKDRVPQKERDELDAELKKTCSQRDQYQKVLTSSFDALKACDWSSTSEQKKGEKKLFGPLNTLVKQIGADPSLVEAASNALAKNPAQRGDFDIMVVDQLEAVLHQPLAVLNEQIRQQESSKEAKETQLQEGNAAVALAEQQLKSCEDELAAYKKEHSELLLQVEECKAASEGSDQILQQTCSAYEANLSFFEQANKSLVAFRFLHERRIAPLPESSPPAASEIDVVSAVAEQTETASHTPQVTTTDLTLDIAVVPVVREPDVATSHMEAESREADVAMSPTREIPSVEAESQEMDVSPVVEVNMPNGDVEMPAEEPSATELPGTDIQKQNDEAAAKEPTEMADPCWDFIQGLDPGSDPFSDKYSSSNDPSFLKKECRDLNAVAVTSAGRIKFALPPRNEWVPPRDDDDEFGTWVWKGNDGAKVSHTLEEGGVAMPEA